MTNHPTLLPVCAQLWDHCFTAGPDYIYYFVVAYFMSIRYAEPPFFQTCLHERALICVYQNVTKCVRLWLWLHCRGLLMSVRYI